MKSILVLTALAIGTAAMAQSNAAPERDARGIPVVSAPATAPAGANQTNPVPAGAQVTANPNQASVFQTQPANKEYPPCTRDMTDGCVQTYERGRAPR